MGVPSIHSLNQYAGKALIMTSVQFPHEENSRSKSSQNVLPYSPQQVLGEEGSTSLRQHLLEMAGG
jgi:hypothetical protein